MEEELHFQAAFSHFILILIQIVKKRFLLSNAALIGQSMEISTIKYIFFFLPLFY